MAIGVSVIVPCYNGGLYIESTLRAVLSQADTSLEVVVVDDGSSDDSAAVVERVSVEDPRVRLVRQKNAGVAEARNTGFAAIDASARFVMFLDADDVLEPGALRTMQAALCSATDVCAVAGPCFRIDAHGVRARPHQPTGFDAYEATDEGVRHRVRVGRLTYRHMLPTNAIWTPGQCLLRRDAIPDRPFDRRFSPCEDWELWLRLTRVASIATVPEAVLGYRDHPASASKRYEVMRGRKRDVLASQLSSQDPAGRALVERAYWFALFRYDEVLCRQWARDAWSQRRVVDCARFGVRALRVRLNELRARRRDHHVHWTDETSL